MARYVLRVAIALAAVWVLSGCSSGNPMVSVVRGNLAYGRGDYQGALVHYLSTSQQNSNRGWLLFNTGNVYYALGEQEAALTAWEDARNALVDPDAEAAGGGSTNLLIHAASYNRGVLFYQRGEYRDAYDEFRYALSVNSQSLSAKANLELSLQKIRSAEQAQEIGGGAAREETEGEMGATTIRILEYVRRKEAQKWFANREADDSPDARDW